MRWHDSLLRYVQCTSLASSHGKTGFVDKFQRDEQDACVCSLFQEQGKLEVRWDRLFKKGPE